MEITDSARNRMFSNKDLVRLIIPLIIEQMLTVTVGLADSIMTANVGEEAVSGVSLVDSVMVLMINLFSALATGGAVVAGQFLGQRKNIMACKTADQLILFIVSLSVVIIDTAGRLQIDEKLMQELANVKEIAHPDEILLVVDSLAGQEIVNVASTFNDRLGITGAVLTKLDGDARGGGALSIRHVTHVPIKYIGTGEKLDEIDYFYPDRMADRILGMGDVVSLVEKVQDVYDEKESMKAFNKMKAGTFGLDDMLDQMKKLQKMGPLSGLLKMIPGMPKIPNLNDDDAAAKMKMTESIIYSMTKAERANPDMINSSRKERIAKGCGQPVTEVNKLLKQFEQSRKVMKQLGNIDPTTGMPTQRPMKTQQQFNPYRKKTRHKKKKK